MNSNSDFTNQDAVIYLAASRRKGTWATEVRLKNGRRVRTAGSTTTEASSHTLLTIGAIAAMKSISGNTIKKINVRYRERKARLKIVSTDHEFVDALRALTSDDATARAENPLRAGGNFVRPLLKQVSRFDVTMEADVNDRTFAFQALTNWVQETVDFPRKFERLPSFLAPDAAAESV